MYVDAFKDFALHEDQEMLVVRGWARPFTRNMAVIFKQTDDADPNSLSQWQEIYNSMYDCDYEQTGGVKLPGVDYLPLLFPGTVKCIVILANLSMAEVVVDKDYLQRFRRRFEEITHGPIDVNEFQA